MFFIYVWNVACKFSVKYNNSWERKWLNVQNLSGVSWQSFSFFFYHGILHICGSFFVLFRGNVMVFPLWLICYSFIQCQGQTGLFFCLTWRKKSLLTFSAGSSWHHGHSGTKILPLPLFGLSFISTPLSDYFSIMLFLACYNSPKPKSHFTFISSFTLPLSSSLSLFFLFPLCNNIILLLCPS